MRRHVCFLVGCAALAASSAISVVGAPVHPAGHEAPTATAPAVSMASGQALGSDIRRMALIEVNAAPAAASTVAAPLSAPGAVPPMPVPSPQAPVAPTARPATARATPDTHVAAPSASPDSIVGIIDAAAQRHGVDPTWMVKIARCESGLNPRAYNPAGPYEGLFQFLPSTFAHNGGTNIWDPVQQAEVTATMLSHGQARQWGCA
jgi:soluble lytic murein transglycosylase-like protein